MRVLQFATIAAVAATGVNALESSANPLIGSDLTVSSGLPGCVWWCVNMQKKIKEVCEEECAPKEEQEGSEAEESEEETELEETEEEEAVEEETEEEEAVEEETEEEEAVEEETEEEETVEEETEEEEAVEEETEEEDKEELNVEEKEEDKAGETIVDENKKNDNGSLLSIILPVGLFAMTIISGTFLYFKKQQEEKDNDLHKPLNDNDNNA